MNQKILVGVILIVLATLVFWVFYNDGFGVASESPVDTVAEVEKNIIIEKLTEPASNAKPVTAEQKQQIIKALTATSTPIELTAQQKAKILEALTRPAN